MGEGNFATTMHLAPLFLLLTAPLTPYPKPYANPTWSLSVIPDLFSTFSSGQPGPGADSITCCSPGLPVLFS